MAFFSWSRWLRSLLRPHTKPIHKRTSRLTVEALETRLAPATFQWLGGTDGNWATGANWSTGVAPSTSTPGPINLIFPESAAGTHTLTNNIGTGTTLLNVNSISFSGTGNDYIFSNTGNAIILGSTTNAVGGQTGQITLAPGENEEIDFGMTLGGGGTSQQNFMLPSTSTLTLGGNLSGTAGTGWEQTGSGTMVLGGDNTNFTGAFTLAGGVTQIQTGTALGTSAASSNVTNVLAGAQLQVSSTAGITVPEHIRLNKTGLASTGPTAGVLLNEAGNNTWTGQIELDDDVTFGVAANTTLKITGQITDLEVGHNVTKEGLGTLDLAAANTYRGTTTINNGIVAIQNGQALGTGPGGAADDSTADAITVNTNSADGETGTLQLIGPMAGKGITVANKLLILNGQGFGGGGALDNHLGFNTWTGSIILGSDAGSNQTIYLQTDGTDPHYSLTVSGVISDPNFTPGSQGPPVVPAQYHNLVKGGPGVLILTNSNTYGGTTEIKAGTIQIDDSQALGPQSKTNATTVDSGASLQLAVDNIADSITHTRNTLNIYAPITITGNGDGNIGALSSLSGINAYYGTITLTGNAAIGVTADPNPTNTGNYLTKDFSLTIEPAPGTTTSNLIGGTFILTKLGSGQLILPTANDQFTGNTTIKEGWITIENDDSLGAMVATATQNGQPLVTVDANAALMFDAPAGTALNLHQNFNISGIGIKHSFGEINGQGAIENLAGINTIEGNVFINGPTNIGVEAVFGPSQLSLLGEQQEAANVVIPVTDTASGGSAESDNIIDTGATSGTITINYNMYTIPDTIDVYYGVKGAGGIDIKPTGPLSGSGTLKVPYKPVGGFSTTTVEIVIDQGGGTSGTAWTYTANIQPKITGGPNITKVGSGLLDIQGSGSFTGPIDIQQGVVLNQNSTGLGGGGGTTTVQPGAALALANGTAYNNGGVEGGIQVRGEHLVVDSDTSLQTVTVTGPLANLSTAVTSTFSLNLTVNGLTQTTGQIAATIPATVASTDTNATDSLQNALQAALKSLNFPSATVSVTQVGDVYQVRFGNLPAGTTAQLAVASVSDANVNVTIGSGIGNNSLGAPAAPFSVWASTTSEWNSAVTLLQPSAYLATLTTTTVNGKTVGSNDIIPTDIQWLGPVTLEGSTAIDVPASSRLIIGGAIDDSTNPTGASDLVKIGTGELTLQGVNTYHGSTYVGTSATADAPGFDPDGFNDFFNGGAVLGGGVLTAASDQSLGAAATDTLQQLTFTNAVTTKNPTQFQLVFASPAMGPATTQTLTYTGIAATDALNIQNALNGLPNIGGALFDTNGNVTQAAANPNGQVTVTPTTTAGQFTIDFGGSFAGFTQQLAVQLVLPPGGNPAGTTAVVSTVATGIGGVVVQNGASLQLEGNVTIAGKTLVLSGQGYNPGAVPLVVPNWSELGPAPVLKGPTIGTANKDSIAGRVTGIAVDPTDPTGQTIYVSTDGGAFKTTDGGKTWIPIFDTYGMAKLGAISISSSNPNVLYIGTGELAAGPISGAGVGDPTDNAPGIGAFMSTDGGHSWSLVTGATSPVNPLKGLAITKIAVDQGNSSIIYVATSDQVPGATGTPGIWRFDGTNWLNLTGIVSSNRATNKGSQTSAPNSPGPDDNYLYNFPQSNVTWSDVAEAGDDTGNNNVNTVFAALGTPAGTTVTNFGKTNDANAVYFAINPEQSASNFAWYLGDGKTDGESTVDVPQQSSAGNIKISVFNAPANHNDAFDGGSLTVQAVYAGTSGNFASQYTGTVASGGSLVAGLEMSYAADKPSAPADGLDQYSLAIYAPDQQNIYIGTQSNLQWSSNSGGAFSDITKDSNSNAPHLSFHALAGAGGFVYAATDGGIWQLNTTGGANTWTDISVNLANALATSVSSSPTNPGDILAGTQATGIDQYVGSLAWNLGTVQGNAGTSNFGYTPDGTRVVFNPLRPNIAYAFVSDAIIDPPSNNGGAPAETPKTTLMQSTDGGKTWSKTGTSISGYAAYQPALVVDAVNSLRLVIGSPNGLQESLNGATSFRTLTSPGGIGAITGVAIATYQGPFIGDAGFPNVSDQGANTDVPGTIYVTDGNSIFLTRDYTQTWANRSIPGVASNISDIEVDPSNSNVIYATIGTAGAIGGTGRVYKSVDGGQNWKAIGGVITGNTNDGLPDAATNRLLIDTRTGNIYVGDSLGVYELASGATQWNTVGTGMPNVAVADLSLNQAGNTLLAATYGRGIMALPLGDVQANTGALTTVSGQTQWTGSIVLTGATTISAQGSQTLANGLSASQLIVSGPISDLTDTTNNGLTVGSAAGAGTVTFSGPNLYQGTTDIVDGVLVASNQTALGSTISGTTVESGAALQLAASLDAEQVTLNGNGAGPGINGHNTGALEGVASNISFQGPIILNTTNVTIGVISGASLRLTGQITGSGSLTKELTGTLILDQTQQDSYLNTIVNQGLLLVESSMALSAAGSVTVLDGAQIGLETPTDPNDPNHGAGVTAQGSLSLSGSGTQNQGALINLGGKNTWVGNVTLDANPGFDATTYPVGTITIGVGLNGNSADPTDVLTISGNISEGTSGLYSGLTKTGPDTLVLAGTDNYNGTTFVNSGVVRIQNAQALGDPNNQPIQRVSVFDPGQNGSFTLSLTLNGQTGTTPSAILTNTNATTMASTVETQLNLMLTTLLQAAKISGTLTASVTGVPISLTGSSVPEVILSIALQGTALTGLNLPQLVALASGGATVVESEVADNGYGTEVASGAALQLDLGNAASNTVTENVQLNGTGPTNAVGISAASETGTTVTITTATANDFQNGELVSISGVTPAGYSGTFPITVVDATHFTFTAPAGLGSATLSTAQAVPAIGNGALENISGVNTLSGAVNLQTSSVIGVYANQSLGSQLTITGAVTGSWAAALNKVGGGTLGLASANQYQGTTFITQGAISAQNSLALGGPLTDEVQTITLTSALTGSYTLTFTNNNQTQTTGSISASASANDLATALQNLPNMPANSVQVTFDPLGTVYTITFLGTLAGMNLGNPGPLTLNSASTGTEVDVATSVQGGQGNTIVSAGAALQLAGTTNNPVQISTEQLILSGTGVGGQGALESVAGGNSWDPATQPISASDQTKPDTSIILDGNTTIGVDFGSALTIDQTVAESQTPSNLTKTGQGTMVFTGTTSNTYSGLTTVANGTLELAKYGSTAVDIPANLQVGDGVGGVGTALAQLEPPPANQPSATQLGAGATLTILSDGSFDLNGQAQTVAALNMTGGNVNLTNTAGSFTVNGTVTAVEDSGGTPAIIESGQSNVGGSFTASSTGTTVSFAINAPSKGTDKVDLDIQVPITCSQQIVKSGNGRLELDADSSASFTNTIADNAGDVQVDGVVGEIDINGGGVSGKGTVGVLDGTGPGTAVNGTVSPGDNTSPLSPIGILTNNFGTTSESWNASTTYAVDLTHISAGAPVAGLDNDELVINGASGTNLDLGNATLVGTATNKISLNDSFTILSATGGAYISGKFALVNSQPIVYLGGSKFNVNYIQNPSLPAGEWSSVVLVRAKQTVTSMTLSSSLPNSSSYGQDVTFTAALTVDGGLPATAPTGSQMTFTLDKGTASAQSTTVTVQNDKGVFDPDTAFHQPLSVGTHTIDVSFVPGTNAIAGPTNNDVQIKQQVTTAATVTSLSLSQGGTTVPSGGSVVYSAGTPVEFAVLVNPKLTVLADAALPGNPDMVALTLTDLTTGANVAVPSGVLGSAPGSPANGFTFGVSNLAIGSYRASVTYKGSATGKDYASSVGGPILFTVKPDASSVLLTASAAGNGSGSQSVFGQLVTFTAIISSLAPGDATPKVGADSVTFTDNGNSLGKVLVSKDPSGNYVAVLQTTALTVGTHTILAKYSGSTDGKLAGNQGQLNPEPFTVNVDKTKISLSATPPNNWGFGDGISFVASVSAVLPGGGTPTGTVSFYDDINSTTNPTLLFSASVGGKGTALFNTSALTIGPHDIYAVYGGSTSFLLSTSNHITQTVLLGTQTVLSSSENPANVGDTVTFTAVVSPQQTTSNPLTGTVAFFDATTKSYIAAGLSPNAAGQYITSTSTLGFVNSSTGHQIEAIFTPSGNVFAGSTSSMVNQLIRSATAIALSSASSNPSAMNQSISLTATVTANPTTNGTPTSGVVTFFNTNGNTTTQIGTANVGAGGIAVFKTAGLAKGTYNFTANYGGTSLWQPSGPSNTLAQTVLYGSTTNLTITPASPASSSGTLTFTAAVRAASGTPSGAGMPSGTVTFYDTSSGAAVAIADPTSGNTAIPLSSSGNAVIRIPGLTLGVASHSIYAAYNGSTTFVASQSTTINEKVISSTSVALSSSSTLDGAKPNTYDSVFSETVTFSATVTPTVAGTTLTGTVTFKDGTTVLGKPVAVTLVGTSYVAVAPGIATLTVANHTITATYTPGTNEPTAGGSGTITQSVTADPTGMTVTTSKSLSAFGETVTFIATVSNAPGSATPLGTVTFKDGTNVLASGVAFTTTKANDYESVLKTAGLSVATHTITAVFVPNSGLGSVEFKTSSNTVTQTVQQVGTTTTVGSSLNPSAVGQTVTLSATVTPTAGSATPTGTVTFYDDTSGSAVPLPGGTNVPVGTNGVAILKDSTLAFGTYQITAQYTSTDATDFANSPMSAQYKQSVFNQTQTTLSASTPSSTSGASVTFSATVTAVSDPQNHGTPTGSVQFMIGNGTPVTVKLGTDNLGGNAYPTNVAVFITSSLPSGTDTITALYTGDGSYYAASTASVQEQVFAAAASIKASITSPASGQAQPGGFFTVTAQIYDSSKNLITSQPAGSQATLQIFSGTTATGTPIATATATFTSGKFTFANLRVAQGNYVLHVVYNGVFYDLKISPFGRLS